ncbi:hypothetical protein E2C01_011488 [Portunus trituberculatus]|uniref:Uncharacterized protein n=1 Tax=Portunus trituberculatus TaxID=210409 RepID=A0A5B7DBD8_PORTR|nr:hypothetical protein [Portunus trituberculatus]
MMADVAEGTVPEAEPLSPVRRRGHGQGLHQCPDHQPVTSSTTPVQGKQDRRQQPRGKGATQRHVASVQPRPHFPTRRQLQQLWRERPAATPSRSSTALPPAKEVSISKGDRDLPGSDCAQGCLLSWGHASSQRVWTARVIRKGLTWPWTTLLPL